jgi:hypothetical protein
VVTQKHYEAALPEEALRGMRLLEAKTEDGQSGAERESAEAAKRSHEDSFSKPDNSRL